MLSFKSVLYCVEVVNTVTDTDTRVKQFVSTAGNEPVGVCCTP